ncbi:RNA-directed DNA polymerase, eukaryota [Tanacetum coccineum]
MNALSLNVQGLGSKTKKEWVKGLVNANKLNFLAIQETKLSNVSDMEVKFLWGNSNYDFVCSDSLVVREVSLVFGRQLSSRKDNVTISIIFMPSVDGTWLPSNSKILFIVIYAPQPVTRKRILWDYISSILVRWKGESILMGDFNEVRSSAERRGSCFNPYGARYFNRFITISGLTRPHFGGGGVEGGGSDTMIGWEHINAVKSSFRQYAILWRLSSDQVEDMDRGVSRDEIRTAV